MNTIDYYTKQLSEWNDAMYQEHPTPYTGKIAGIIEKQRVKAVLNFATTNNNDHVLEIGCESGQILSKIDKAERVVGLDISKVALSDAKKRVDGKTELIFTDAEKIIKHAKLPEKSFDVVICSQVLEHVANPKAIINNIYRLAKDDARIIISVPNELFMLKLKILLSKTGLMGKLLPGIEPQISEWHLQIFTHNKIKDLVKNSYHIVKLRRVFNVYLVYLLFKKTDNL